ncbi:hypothetical protein [Ascidiimonas aurantiaca]|uniref:hypothetical protein n=1 Tax=Ascidiimonas aurantiaca TaxID=1685432 RepID=UPI0030EE3633
MITIVVAFVILVYLSVSETEDHFRTCEILDVSDIDQISFRDFDSVTVAANTLYEASLLKEIMQGEQYRDAWESPVTVPIAFLDTLKGGLKVIEQGGGKQTHSLELEDRLGIRYTLRSLSKDPSKLVPDIVATLGLENIVVDGVSAQHPYAAPVVAQLSEAANILHTKPELLFVPIQKTLGDFNDKFGNRLYFFEYESEGKVNWTGLDGIINILDTKDLQKLKLKEGDKVSIDQNTLIRARLFDLVIGDWDRHAKQWGWAIKKVKDEYIAIPVPTDRDNAFFNLDGILPNLIANDITYPEIQTFDSEIDFMQGYVRTFDEYFLRTATSERFRTEAIRLQNQLNNREIEKAFKAWPATIDSLNGPEIRKKIKARRAALIDYADEFYRILKERPMQNIELKGSEELELSGHLLQCFDCKDPAP